jgi:hypothetical protein
MPRLMRRVGPRRISRAASGANPLELRMWQFFVTEVWKSECLEMGVRAHVIATKFNAPTAEVRQKQNISACWRRCRSKQTHTEMRIHFLCFFRLALSLALYRSIAAQLQVLAWLDKKMEAGHAYCQTTRTHSA